jgi:hypothetical protein
MGIFLRNIEEHIDKTIAKQHDIVRDIVTEIVATPIELSPVDTGNFVSNWLLGLNGNIPWGVTGIKNQDKEYNVVRVTSRIPNDAANHTYTLVNNTSYAQALEDGNGTGRPHSKQARFGMIGLTTLMAPEIIRRVLASYK